jgi:hypothetical protein
MPHPRARSPSVCAGPARVCDCPVDRLHLIRSETRAWAGCGGCEGRIEVGANPRNVDQSGRAGERAWQAWWIRVGFQAYLLVQRRASQSRVSQSRSAESDESP